MSPNSQWITVDEAAQTIFGTKSPTPPQMQKVAFLLAKGVLRANARKTHVTADSVARYVATRMENRRLAHTAATTRDGGHKHCEQRLKTLYRIGLGDYLASLFDKKRRDQLSPPQRRAVLAGQAVGIVLTALIVCWVMYNTLIGPPAELAIVQDHMAAEIGECRIVRWSAPQYWEQDASTSIKVQFESVVAGRKKMFQRTFVIKEGQVIGW